MFGGSAACCRSTMGSFVEKDDWERLKAAKKKEMHWPLAWVLSPLVPLYNVPKNWRYTEVWLELELINTFCGKLLFFFCVTAGDAVATLRWRVENLMQCGCIVSGYFWRLLRPCFVINTSMLNFCHFILYPYSIVRELFILLLMYIIMILTWKATVSSVQKVLQSLWIVPQCLFFKLHRETLNHFQCCNSGNICSADYVSYHNTDKQRAESWN